MKNRTVLFARMYLYGGIVAFCILLSGCVGFSIKKPSPPKGINENYLIENPDVKISQNSNFALLVTSYDFIKQQSQPFFLADHDVPEYIYLDYHHSADNIAFDEVFREKIQLFFKNECSVNILDMKTNKEFKYLAKSTSLQISEVIAWLKTNTNIDVLIVFHYSLGEKGEINPDMFLGAIAEAYYAFNATKIHSAFTFQASAFDVHRKERIMAYNFPDFVDPKVAVDVFITKMPDMTAKTKTFYEVLSQIFD